MEAQLHPAPAGRAGNAGQVGDAGHVGHVARLAKVHRASPAATSPAPTLADPAATHVRYPRLTVPSGPAAVALVAGALLLVILLAAARALPIFFVGIALAYLVDPAVTGLSRRGMPRWLASAVVVILLSLVLVAFVAIVAGAVISQGAAFVAAAPAAVQQAQALLADAPISPAFRAQLDGYVGGLGASLGGIDPVTVVSGIATPLFGVLDVTFALIGLPFYVVLVVADHPSLTSELERRLPAPWRADIVAVSRILGGQFGNYFRSEAVLMVLLGLLTWAGLMLLSLLVDPRIASYALFLAVIAAFSELIPLFGPWIAAIPAVMYGLTLGPTSLVAMVALYVVVSFVEGNVLVPAIEGRSFALRPAIVGPVIAVGLALGGAFGAVLAIPAASAARDIYVYLFRRAAGQPTGYAPDAPDRGHAEDAPLAS